MPPSFHQDWVSGCKHLEVRWTPLLLMIRQWWIAQSINAGSMSTPHVGARAWSEQSICRSRQDTFYILIIRRSRQDTFYILICCLGLLFAAFVYIYIGFQMTITRSWKHQSRPIPWKAVRPSTRRSSWLGSAHHLDTTLVNHHAVDPFSSYSLAAPIGNKRRSAVCAAALSRDGISNPSQQFSA